MSAFYRWHLFLQRHKSCSGSNRGKNTAIFEDDNMKTENVSVVMPSSGRKLPNMRMGYATSEGQEKAIQAVFRRYSPCFPNVSRPLGSGTGAEHVIDTGTAAPQAQPPYWRSWSERVVIRQEVDEMLQARIVSPPGSPWASPFV